MSGRVASAILLTFFITGFLGCGDQQGANVAEPKVLTIENGGIPDPYSGMPGSMKKSTTVTKTKPAGDAAEKTDKAQ